MRDFNKLDNKLSDKYTDFKNALAKGQLPLVAFEVGLEELLKEAREKERRGEFTILLQI